MEDDDDDPNDTTDYRTLNIDRIMRALETIEGRIPDDVMAELQEIMKFCAFSLHLMDIVTVEQVSEAADRTIKSIISVRDKKIQ